MVNLVGLVIGSTLARRAEVPAADVQRFALPGSVPSSPLLGAVFVNAAIGQRRGDRDLVLGASAPTDLTALRERRERQRERERERDNEREQARRRQQQEQELERQQRHEDAAFDDVLLALTAVRQSMAGSREVPPSFDAAMDEFRASLRQLEDVVQDREGGGGGSGDS
jgi:hypothetical protein